MTYARNTTVSMIPTRNEIQETLNRYGADGFAYATQGNLATVIFAMENRRIRFLLELPDLDDFQYTNHSPPRERSVRAQHETHDRAGRQRWRALILVIKAKLEVITAGISTIETEFLAKPEYKCAWFGVECVKADRWYASSKLCAHCGWKNDDLTLSDREWWCVGCGALDERDYNAAVNLGNWPGSSFPVSGRGDRVRPATPAVVVEASTDSAPPLVVPVKRVG